MARVIVYGLRLLENVSNRSFGDTQHLNSYFHNRISGITQHLYYEIILNMESTCDCIQACILEIKIPLTVYMCTD